MSDKKKRKIKITKSKKSKRRKEENNKRRKMKKEMKCRQLCMLGRHSTN